MSAAIGQIRGIAVRASRHGVELVDDGSGRAIDPIAARNLASLIERAAEEVERMRRIDPEASRDERAGYAMAKRDALAMVAFHLIDKCKDTAHVKEIISSIEDIDYERSSPTSPPRPKTG